MEKRRNHKATKLNEHDRKILDKYTKFYSNFIESNTADNNMVENKKNERGEY